MHITEETFDIQVQLKQIENHENLIQNLSKWWYEKHLKGYLKISEIETTNSY